ncbi:MAG: trypsin-like peptidase domain-containing protein [Elusimicrobiota bacterium]|jgi:hypothetical protein
MKKILGAFAAIVLCGMLTAAQAQQIEVIYGDDDRLDIYQVTNAKLLKMADSTAALFEGGSVTVDGAKAALATRPYGEGMRLCKEEPFYEQRNGAFCSGSLIGPDLLMTAGHCIETEEACKDVKFVFGFAVTKKGVNPESVPATEVYGCGKLLGRAQVDDGADWALVKLDRRVLNHTPLKLNRTGKIADKTPLLVIGHPAGLPTKVAGGASVRDASPEGYFVANLDTYGGNSGSAVFNAGTGLVEGILVRGENDYVWKGSCRVSNKCPADGCRGEDVTKISAVSTQVPKTMAESYDEVQLDTAFLQALDQASQN